MQIGYIDRPVDWLQHALKIRPYTNFLIRYDASDQLIFITFFTYYLEVINKLYLFSEKPFPHHSAPGCCVTPVVEAALPRDACVSAVPPAAAAGDSTPRPARAERAKFPKAEPIS
jgi:hypothetical protein